jgi:hypothetical protein
MSEGPDPDISGVRMFLNIFNNYVMEIALQCNIQSN